MKKKGMIVIIAGFLVTMILCLSGGTFGYHPSSGDALITAWTRDLPAPKILLVSSAVKDGDVLANAAGEGVIVLKYDTRTTSLDALNAMIQKALKGRKASSIAIAAHDYGENRFYLTKSKTVGLGSTLGDLEQRAFWKKMGEMVAQEGRIDLLACRLAAGDKGALLLASLESAAGVNFAASTDATGNSGSKGNWILETDGIDLKGVYFNPEKLDRFKGLLWGYEKVLHEDQWVIDPGQNFGSSVSLSGDTALVGAYSADIDGKAEQGAAYIFVKDGKTWTQQARLSASDGAEGDYFGYSVSLSGDTALVGAYGANIDGKADQGAAYIFKMEGASWTQQAKLSASDGAEGDYFGYSVSLSGDTALVGAYGADIDGMADQGAAYIFVKDGATWTQQTRLTASDGAESDRFGYSVFLSGDTALVGAYGANIDGKADQGAAYIFKSEGATWTQQTRLTASDGAEGDYFGYSVSLSGDTALVGAPAADIEGKAQQGAAYVFSSDGANWTQQAKLSASDGAEWDRFAYSVSLSGDTALVGASYATIDGNSGQGAAYVFSSDGANWTQQAKLSASDGAEWDQFGISVSLSGDTALVGAHSADIAGQAYIFDGGDSWKENQILKPPADTLPYDQFGISVSLSGDTALVGASYATIEGKARQGAAYIFKSDGATWTQQAKLTASDGAEWDYFGYSVSLSGDTALVGASHATIDGKGEQGAAYIFKSEGATWTQQAKLTASDGAKWDEFGSSVSLSGDTALVGAGCATIDGKIYQGAAYIFRRDGANWTQQAKLTASDGAEWDEFGYSVSLSGNQALVGARYATIDGKASQGAAYVFSRDGANWTQQAKLTASDGAEYDDFGSWVSLSDDHALVGAPGPRHAYVYANPTAPNTQAGNIGFSNVAQGRMDVSWTRGNGDRVLVVARQGAAVGSDPVDGTSYTADAAFGSGSEIGTGNFVVYKGTGTGVTVTGLTAETDYHFRAYEFNDTYTEKYNTDTATDNPNNQRTLPHAPGTPTATAASDITQTGFMANWDAAQGATGYFLDVSTTSGFTDFVPGYENRDVGVVTTFAVTGLTTATDYYYRLRAQNPGGTSGNSNVVTVTTSDGSGVPADIQNGAPNNGDGNGDGIKDSLQTNVVSLPSATGRGGTYITLVVTGCDRLENVHVCTCESVGTPDPGYDYPFDLVGFNIPCGSATVRIYYHGSKGLQGFEYRKFGPTPNDWNTAIWYTMPGATFGSKIIDKRKVFYVEFLLTEAKLGDDTPVFPIVDQGGVAISTVIPTLNEWGILVLSLFMIGIAFGIMRRRKAGH